MFDVWHSKCYQNWFHIGNFINYNLLIYQPSSRFWKCLKRAKGSLSLVFHNWNRFSTCLWTNLIIKHPLRCHLLTPCQCESCNPFVSKFNKCVPRCIFPWCLMIDFFLSHKLFSTFRPEHYGHLLNQCS